VIRYAERIHFSRGLGILVESLRTGLALPVREQPQFATNGLMIDVSQGNAVPRRETVERILRRMALMGLNLIMLYAEDSYTVPEEPEFGWMRARYTQDEMRAIDGYAARLCFVKQKSPQKSRGSPHQPVGSFTCPFCRMSACFIR